RATRLRILQDEIDGWRSFRNHEDLVGEQRSADADQELVDRQGGCSEPAVAEHFREGRRDTPNLTDPESGIREQPSEGPEREEPRVRMIEDARLAIVELAKRKHDALHHEGDVWRGEHEGLRRVVELATDSVEEPLRILQVL